MRLPLSGLVTIRCYCLCEENYAPPATLGSYSHDGVSFVWRRRILKRLHTFNIFSFKSKLVANVFFWSHVFWSQMSLCFALCLFDFNFCFWKVEVMRIKTIRHWSTCTSVKSGFSAIGIYTSVVFFWSGLIGFFTPKLKHLQMPLPGLLWYLVQLLRYGRKRDLQ